MADKDRIRGSAAQANGNVKEVVGKATGDRSSKAKAKLIRGAIGGAELIPRQLLHHSLS